MVKECKEKHIVADDRMIEEPAPSETHVRDITKMELLAGPEDGGPDAQAATGDDKADARTD